MTEFNKVEDLKQLKSDEELTEKCNEIIDSLEGYTKNEKFRILTTLYDSFVDACNKEVYYAITSDNNIIEKGYHTIHTFLENITKSSEIPTKPSQTEGSSNPYPKNADPYRLPPE